MICKGERAERNILRDLKGNSNRLCCKILVSIPEIKCKLLRAVFWTLGSFRLGIAVVLEASISLKGVNIIS